ncbi:MAG: hypothetical protein AB7E30_11305 [Lawsonibacter sp.]
MDHQFRSSMFGGFNRQDVLAYLENASKEAAQRQQELQQNLDEARNTMSRQDADLAEQQEQLNRFRQENEELRAQLEQTNIALSSSRTECSQRAGELEQARREAEEYRAKIAALEPDASAYAAIKERTAGVELEAHRRAQTVQEQAEQQARQLHRQMEQWMQKVEREYDTLRSQVESTVSHAADELEKAGKCLEQVTILMEERDIALETMAQTYTAPDPAKVAPPMPLSEQ